MDSALLGFCRRSDLRPRVDGRSVVLWWCGRIDNPLELSRHSAAGVPHDNPAALARAVYERHGIDGLRTIVGDWSAVIRDDRSGAIVLASDFAGVWPLYFDVGHDHVRWSPRLAALRQRSQERCDEHFISGFITSGGYPGRTPIEHIRSVIPGKAIRITRQAVSTHTFWSEARLLDPAPVARSDYDEQFRQLFREAVAVRLNSPGIAVAELSGGWDSSSVVCVADTLIREGAVPATGLATVSYVHERSTDVRYIDEVEQQRRQVGTHLSATTIPLFSAAVESSEWPGGVTPLQRAAAAAANRHYPGSFLTGQGGDLVCANWIDDSLQVAHRLRTGQFGMACAETLAWSRATGVPVQGILANVVAESLPRVLRSPVRRWRDSREHAVRTMSLCAGFVRRTGLANIGDAFSSEWESAPPERRRQLRELNLTRELRSLQAPEPLRHFSYTHPFFHRPLIEFLTRVPVDLLCGPGQPRRLMRQALGRLLPIGLRGRRSKSLFGGPLLQAFVPFASALLKTREWNVVARGWIDRAGLRERLERLTRGLPCHEPQLRQILMLESWLCQAGQATLA